MSVIVKPRKTFPRGFRGFCNSFRVISTLAVSVCLCVCGWVGTRLRNCLDVCVCVRARMCVCVSTRICVRVCILKTYMYWDFFTDVNVSVCVIFFRAHVCAFMCLFVYVRERE